jgi:hypothetical protein
MNTEKMSNEAENHALNNAAVGSSTFFKVKFLYDKEQQGRSVWIENIRVFDAVNADDLHLKIDKYMKERTTDTVNRWYYMKMVDVERL